MKSNLRGRKYAVFLIYKLTEISPQLEVIPVVVPQCGCRGACTALELRVLEPDARIHLHEGRGQIDGGLERVGGCALASLFKAII